MAFTAPRQITRSAVREVTIQFKTDPAETFRGDVWTITYHPNYVAVQAIDGSENYFYSWWAISRVADKWLYHNKETSEGGVDPS